MPKFKKGNIVRVLENRYQSHLANKSGQIIEIDNNYISVRFFDFKKYLSKTDCHIVYIGNLKHDTISYIKKIKNESK